MTPLLRTLPLPLFALLALRCGGPEPRPISTVLHDARTGSLEAVRIDERVDSVIVVGATAEESNLEGDVLCERGYQRYATSVRGDFWDQSSERLAVFLRKDRFETHPDTAESSQILPLPFESKAALVTSARDLASGALVWFYALHDDDERDVARVCEQLELLKPGIVFGATREGTFVETTGEPDLFRVAD